MSWIFHPPPNSLSKSQLYPVSTPKMILFDNILIFNIIFIR